MNQIISVKNLVKKYKKSSQNAVDEISFEVKEGEFFAFLGPNGAGKTTTISILTTTLSKTSGDVNIAGFDIDKQSSQVRRKVGIIFQNPSLDLNLTAEENIRFHAILYGLYPFRPLYSLMPESYKKRVNELADILDLKGEMYKPVKKFSGGMKRKLEIIRSLMHRPKVLFLDEPTIGLDPQARRNLWQYLKQIMGEEKTTVFLTTHYLEEAEETDHICIINHGKIVKEGTPEYIKRNLIKDYLIVESANKPALITELTRKNIRFEEMAEFKVFIQNKDIQSFLGGLRTKLSNIKTHAPSLEEAYLEIIGEQTINDNTPLLRR
ncbi:MAG TPA: ABC transporter ATP-binding protein [Patescibacteria group bacterium]|nr:ABC transporter ATP-binding protein [Patescibacteria group bacterium]